MINGYIEINTFIQLGKSAEANRSKKILTRALLSSKFLFVFACEMSSGL